MEASVVGITKYAYGVRFSVPCGLLARWLLIRARDECKRRLEVDLR